VNHFLVVVLAYNRPLALRRLLDSLGRVAPAAVGADLVVSIDGGGDPECARVARDAIEWAHGKVEVVVQSERLKLKQHVETAADRVKDYDAVIVLEDDLSVSPWMLHYAASVFARYGEDASIAQFSLYGFQLNEFTGLPFTPVQSEADVWFSRVPSSWGQMWTRTQWMDFRTFQRSNPPGSHERGIPLKARLWKNESWKRGYFEYVVASRKWVVVPYVSLSTNHGDPGIHYAEAERSLEVPLELFQRTYRLPSPEDSPARYDAWFEPLPETLSLEQFGYVSDEVTVDFFGSKLPEEITTAFLLSTKQCRDPEVHFSDHFRPLEMNVRLGYRIAAPSRIHLGKSEYFEVNAVAGELLGESTAPEVRWMFRVKGWEQGRSDVMRGRRYRLGKLLSMPVAYVGQLARKFIGHRKVL